MINFKLNYKIYIWIIIVAVAICILIPVIKNILETEKGRVRKFILKGKRAVEAQDILTCAQMISADYQDKYGNDAQNLIYLTRQTFRYYKEIFVHIDNINIELNDEENEAGVEIEGEVVGLSKRDEEEKILEKERGTLKLNLIKEKKKWQLLEVESFEPTTLWGQKIKARHR